MLNRIWLSSVPLHLHQQLDGLKFGEERGELVKVEASLHNIGHHGHQKALSYLNIEAFNLTMQRIVNLLGVDQVKKSEGP